MEISLKQFDKLVKENFDTFFIQSSDKDFLLEMHTKTQNRMIEYNEKQTMSEFGEVNKFYIFLWSAQLEALRLLINSIS